MIEQKRFCTVPHCNYPTGECTGACWNEEDELRMDVIGSNGNDGEHYNAVPEDVDMVNHPPHYTKGGIECIDAIQAALTHEEFKGYCKAAALKYIWRLEHKGNPEENAEKAIWYLQRLLKALEGK